MPTPPKKFKGTKLISLIVLLFLVSNLVGLVLAVPRPAEAQFIGTEGRVMGGGLSSLGVGNALAATFICQAMAAVPAVMWPGPYPFGSLAGCIDSVGKAIKGKMESIATGEFLERQADKAKKNVWAIAARSALRLFLNTLAYDTANWLASGGKGQKPMFETKGWGPYLKDVADKAAGEYLETVSQDWPTAFNLCEPRFGLKLGITLGLERAVKPKPPRCTLSQMMENWERELTDPDFLKKFQVTFDPWQSEIGTAFEIHAGLIREKKETTEAEYAQRMESLGLKSVTDIAGTILTPGTVVAKWVGFSLSGATKAEEQLTGDIVADAINTFTNTLAGKLFEKWFKEGIAKLYGEEEERRAGRRVTSDVYSYEEAAYGGKAAAETRFAGIAEPDFIVGGPYKVLADLATCPNPEKPGPTECVIDQNFRLAIENKMTVQEALKAGRLNGQAPFGFLSPGYEPAYNQGYPYRSLIILRKYRIIPVGWELAAQYINQFSGETKTLNDLVASYNDPASPFYGLVDPDWVLKAQENYCRREGPGPKITSENITSGTDENSDGDFDDEGETPPALTITRDSNYCADEQTCIQENPDGSCAYYGYCTEEKRRWNFQGTACPQQFNTCQAFENSEGEVVAYLKDSLDYNECSVDNAGCEWYCQEFSEVDGAWRCSEPEYVLTECENYAGCLVSSGTESCTIPQGGVACYTETGVKLSYGLAYEAQSEIYFDQDVEECEMEQAGCHEFIRLKEGLGTNLIANSSFEVYEGDPDDSLLDTFSGWSGIGEAVSGALYGSSAYKFQLFGSTETHIETGLPLEKRTFTLSLYAKDGDSFCAGTFYISGVKVGDLTLSPSWTRFSGSYFFPEGTTPSDLVARIDSSSCLVDGVQLEEAGTASSYKDYSLANKFYLKKAPDYYDCLGFTQVITTLDDEIACESSLGADGLKNFWREDLNQCVESGSEACQDYALYCQAEEVGCELYTPTNRDPAVPGTVSLTDYCPRECVGYETYKQQATYFEPEDFPLYFIPTTGRSCPAAYAGCEEFTNLDEVARGGEGREFYTYLRQCQKPDPGTCATYYTWVGSEVTGYQLEVYSLKEDGTGAPQEVPNPQDLGDCFDLSDALENPECKEFYDVDGEIHYKIFKNTITCSEDCHPLRASEPYTFLGSSIETQDACENYGATWGGGTCQFTDTICEEAGGNWEGGECTLCAGGGSYDVTTEECIFMAIPKQGISCPAQAAGCREYLGNAGSNVYTVFEDNFESAVENWDGTFSLSSESLVVGGHSLKVSALEKLTSPALGELLREQRTYLLSFWAKGEGELEVKFKNAIEPADYFSYETPPPKTTVTLEGPWQSYTLGPVFLTWELLDDEALEFTFDEESFLDNVILKEVTDDIFLIKNSWQTPEVCDQDEFGAEAPQYMLGCQEYQDRARTTYYLKSFTSLCREEVTGCEAFIDTHNSTSPFEERFNEGTASEIIVEEDGLTYLVNDQEKTCDTYNKGCSALGLPALTPEDQVSSYQTLYLKNDPDQYQTILCEDQEVDCGLFTTADSNYYFKDPADKVCEYKLIAGQAQYGWYKKDSTSLEPDCPVVSSSLGIEHPAAGVCLGGDRNGQGCSDFGVANGQCIGDGICEANKWVGLCPAAESGCTEYIDPLSDISKNVLFNGDFEQDADGDGVPDGWEWWWDFIPLERQGLNGSWAVKASHLGGQRFLLDGVDLEPQTLYTLSGYIKKGDAVDEDGNEIDAFFDFEACVNANGELTELSSPDGSLNYIATYYDPLTGLPSNNWGWFMIDEDLLSETEYKRFSARFYTGEVIYCSKLYVGAYGGSAKDPLAGTGHWFDNVEIKETGVYYNLEDTLDKESCAGLVSFDKGCVLFNDRGEIDWREGEADTSYLVYDADQSPTETGIPATQCDNGSYATFCDSSLLLKVRPDRACQEWLYCDTVLQTTGEAGKTEDYCLKVGSCNSLNKAGQCDGIVLKDQENQTYSHPSEASYIRDFSGYNKVGLDWGGAEIIEGYYPFSEMAEVGQVNEIPNGNFEIASPSTQPIGWYVEDYDFNWKKQYFRVINNPVTAQQELGLKYKYAPEGRNFLKVNGDYYATSEFIKVYNNTDYVLSGWLSSVNLKNGQAKVRFKEFDADGTELTGGWSDALVLPAGYEDWQFSFYQLTTQPNTAQIKLQLRAWDGGESIGGSFYYDDLKMMPVLESRDPAFIYTWPNSYPYTRQDCRLYPKPDSLSCEYFGEDGLYYQGWWGYCLERDSKNPKNCLLWWPVDQVAGSSFESGLSQGYTERLPLYYCLDVDMTTEEIVGEDVPKVKGGNNDKCKPSNGQVWTSTLARSLQQNNIKEVELTSGQGIITLNEANGWEDGANKWWGHPVSCVQNCYNFEEMKCNSGGACNSACPQGSHYHSYYAKAYFTEETPSFFSRIEFGSIDHSKDIDGFGWQPKITFRFWERPCYLLSQVVDSTGRNKSWTSRVQEGSSYILPGGTTTLTDELNYIYETDYYPFGGVVNDEPQENPYDWDSRETLTVCSENYALTCQSDYECQPDDGYCTVTINQGRQPIFVELPLTEDFAAPFQVRAGAPYACQSGGDCGSLGVCARGTNFCSVDVDCGALGTCVRGGLTNIDSPQKGIMRLRHLFAESYGAWQWQNKLCEGGVFAGEPCFSDLNCQREASGECVEMETESGWLGTCQGGGDFEDELCDSNEECWEDEETAEAGVFCQNSGFDSICVGGPNNGEFCADTSECLASGAEAEHGICVESEEAGHYLPTQEYTWGPATSQCPSNIRPAYNPADPEADLCAVAPSVGNIRINNQTSGNISIHNSGFVTLTFNSYVDANQLPLRGYAVLWGDGTRAGVSGAAVKDHPSELNPHILTHQYSYWDLRKKDSSDPLDEDYPLLSCPSEEICQVEVKIQVQDNWGWCNGGFYGNSCLAEEDAWIAYSGYVQVSEE